MAASSHCLSCGSSCTVPLFNPNDIALQYERVKEELESKYADDRVAYTNGKQEMIDIILNGK